jgi:two-component system alkaline phosphatase synthesis response regulator PhoP
MAVIQKTKPALMFVDVMMPKKNGFEVCYEIKNDPVLKDIHIILLTAKGQEEDKIKGMELGADEYMTKPFSPSKIVERVQDILG